MDGLVTRLFCFNPCSVGSCSGSKDLQALAKQHGSFNPCSVGSCSGRIAIAAPAKAKGRFQSLFCWIMLGEISGFVVTN